MVTSRIAQLSILVVLLAACTTAATPALPPDLTPAARPTLVPTFTPTPAPSPTPHRLPHLDDLHWRGARRAVPVDRPGYARALILEAIYDGPIDMAGYEYEPVILEKLPSLADGDALIEAATVQAGDRVWIATAEWSS